MQERFKKEVKIILIKKQKTMRFRILNRIVFHLLSLRDILLTS